MENQEKTYKQMLETFKEVRQMVKDANLKDITSVEFNEYCDPTRHHSWININVQIGVGGDFLRNKCRLVTINNHRQFDESMAKLKAVLAERSNKSNEQSTEQSTF